MFNFEKLGKIGKNFSENKPEDKTEFLKKESEKAQKILSNAQNFEELFGAIKRVGNLYGSDGTKYNFQELIQRINMVRENKESLNIITRSGGLREKVQELLISERVDRKIEDLEKILKDVEGFGGGYGGGDAVMPSINFAKQTQEVFNMIFLIKNETLKNNQSKKLKYLLERAKKVFKFKRVSVDALMSIEDLYKKL